MKMAGITQNWQKRLIFIVVIQLRIADGSCFVKKRTVIKLIKMRIIIMSLITGLDRVSSHYA